MPILLLLLLSLCAANGCSMIRLASDPEDQEPCRDERGRLCSWQSYSTCDTSQGWCHASASYRCVAPDLPPRLVDGRWECDEYYELAGTRSTWPGGVLVVQPEKCRPV